MLLEWARDTALAQTRQLLSHLVIAHSEKINIALAFIIYTYQTFILSSVLLGKRFEQLENVQHMIVEYFEP